MAHRVSGVICQHDPLWRALVAGDVVQHPQAAAGLQEDIDDGDVTGLGPAVEPLAGFCLRARGPDDVDRRQFLEEAMEVFEDLLVVLDQ